MMRKSRKLMFKSRNRVTAKKPKTKPHKWSLKYKRSINCNRPRGFSQKQYCKYGRRVVKPSSKSD